jgi:6-pyruvoyltetrahydropterin/6-carboxytetrahydropterin synthase
MYRISKRLEISASHRLSLTRDSKCSRLHGHNWIITIHCAAVRLNQDGMVEDFSEIKQKIHSRLDHANLNEVFDFNPTAENMAKWICDQISTCYRVDVQESEGNTASYEKD